jgi:hypothetical protein
MFYIYGDYGYAAETLLKEYDTLTEARVFFNKYTRNDLGGYEIVEIAQFDEDGEYIVHESRHAENYGEEDFVYDDSEEE